MWKDQATDGPELAQKYIPFALVISVESGKLRLPHNWQWDRYWEMLAEELFIKWIDFSILHSHKKLEHLGLAKALRPPLNKGSHDEAVIAGVPWFRVPALLLELRRARRILRAGYLDLRCLCLLGWLAQEAKCPKAIACLVDDYFGRWGEDYKSWNVHLLQCSRAPHSSSLLPFDFYSEERLCTLLHYALIWWRLLWCQAYPLRLASVFRALRKGFGSWCIWLSWKTWGWYRMFWHQWRTKLRINQKIVLEIHRKRGVYLQEGHAIDEGMVSNSDLKFGQETLGAEEESSTSSTIKEGWALSPEWRDLICFKLSFPVGRDRERASCTSTV